MRIGLVRHFPVEQGFPSGWKTSGELHLWRQRYEASAVIPGSADVGGFAWSQCISSDLDRAVTTAMALFPGPIEQTSLLREVEFAPLATGELRLPIWAWRWILRFAWATGHKSQRSCRDAFLSRVLAVADLLEAREGEILVVSHAGMMAYLSGELRRRGFSGPKLRVAKHATLYNYENAVAPKTSGKPRALD